MIYSLSLYFFFFNDTATTEIYTLSLHDALPICGKRDGPRPGGQRGADGPTVAAQLGGRSRGAPDVRLSGDPGAVRAGHRGMAGHRAWRPAAGGGGFVVGRGPVLSGAVPARAAGPRLPARSRRRGHRLGRVRRWLSASY